MTKGLLKYKLLYGMWQVLGGKKEKRKHPDRYN